ncbi:MAG: hypothetical protein FP824_06540 [Euryarchaeota archaeon]|nr:hypothetical protein [Euryarchaeota archaeon]
MASLGMEGPYELTSEKIDAIITRTSAGNYALGYMNGDSFNVNYVGRSDNDVKKRLKDWVGEYKKFKFSYATSRKDAFEKECRNYHDFGGSKSLDNKLHPERPDDATWACPVCKIFGTIT